MNNELHEQLLNETKVIVQEIEHPGLRTEVLVELIKMGDATSAEQAYTEASSIDDAAVRARAFTQIASTGNVKALDAAYEAITIITGVEAKGRILSDLAKVAITIKALDFARKILNELTDPFYRAPILVELGKEGDVNSLELARAEISKIEDPASRASNSIELVKALVLANDHSSAEEVARVIEDPYYRAMALVELLKTDN